MSSYGSANVAQAVPAVQRGTRGEDEENDNAQLLSYQNDQQQEWNVRVEDLVRSATAPPPPVHRLERAVRSRASRLALHAEMRRSRRPEFSLDKREIERIRSQAHTPYFTCCVSVLQVLVLATSMLKLTGGSVATWGIGAKLVVTRVEGFAGQSFDQPIEVAANMWIGPDIPDVIRWGAKYSPCMRDDPASKEKRKNTTDLEATFGCCVDQFNDCGLMDQWTCENGYGATFEGVGSKCADANCKVTLRPCCYGVQGDCAVVTESHCNALQGTWHTAANECGEVDCLEGVCGMGGFFSAKPDQFFRFASAMMMHIGVIHLLANLSFQWSIGRDLEALCGSWRLAAMYVLSGIGGNVVAALLGSAYSVSAGASSSLYGLIGVTCVDLWYSWSLVRRPWFELGRLVVLLAIVLGIGTLPYIDNFAHLGGFLVGAASAMVFLPYIGGSGLDSCAKELAKYAAAVVMVTCTVFGLGLFYTGKDASVCSWCHYVDCIPWNDKICQLQ